MKIIVTLDRQKGMCFHNRRLSKDRVVIEKINNLIKNHRLWIEPFSESLFDGYEVIVDQRFLEKVPLGEYCFVERQSLEWMQEDIEEVIVFWWNRDYPSDLICDLDFSKFKKVEEEEFAGYSHEKIKKEVFVRCEKRK